MPLPPANDNKWLRGRTRNEYGLLTTDRGFIRTVTRMSRTRSIVAAFGLATLMFAATACVNPEDEASRILKKQGVELDNLGKSVPSSFPKTEVGLPDLKLESAVGTAGIYVFRYTSPDPANDIAAYKAALVAMGFTIDDEFDDLSSSGGHTGFHAQGPRWTVDAVAFGQGQADGHYMGIDVEPRPG